VVFAKAERMSAEALSLIARIHAFLFHLSTAGRSYIQ